MSSKPAMLTSAIELVARAIRRDPSKLTEEDGFGSIPEWDSLSHIMVIECIEEHLGERLNDDAIEKLTTIRAIMALLAEKVK